MTKVKICGIKSKSDVEIINKYIPDYAGFVFAKSKRQVTPDRVAEFGKSLKKQIKKVGVFVNEDCKALIDIVIYCELDVVQLHGDETPRYILELKRLIHEKNHLFFKFSDNRLKERLRIELWKAFRVKDEILWDTMHQYPVDAIVLDTYCRRNYGGSGKAFDWKKASETGTEKKIILAGGLNKDNVHKAISMVSPFAVDVSSGVETDGCKDEMKIKEFVNKVRRQSYAT